MQLALEIRDIVEIATVIGAAVAWVYQWRHGRFRAKLKDDLEILRGYTAISRKDAIEGNDRYQALVAHIERTMYAAYERKSVDWRRVLLGGGVSILGMLNLIVERPAATASLVVGVAGLVTGVTVIAAALASRPRRLPARTE